MRAYSCVYGARIKFNLTGYASDLSYAFVRCLTAILMEEREN